MAIRIGSNAGAVSARLRAKLLALTNPQILVRPVVISLLPVYQERIHDEGKASDGSQIGSYSSSYLHYREENGRGGDRKVIASFTRQLQNASNIVATERGWGIGILQDGRNPTNNYLNKSNKAKNSKAALTNNITNSQLVIYFEATYKKKIFNLTQEEKELAIRLLRVQVKKVIDGILG